MLNRKNAIIGIVIVALLLLIIGWQFVQVSPTDKEEVVEVEKRGIQDEPINVVLDFYESWLKSRNSTSSNPYADQLTDSMALSVAMIAKLKALEETFARGEADPVLCQVPLPSKLKARAIFVEDDTAQILVYPKQNDLGTQAVVSLNAHDGFWEIADITCGNSEQAPEVGEYDFDQAGLLLKDSLPAAFDSKFWHLVFTQDNQPGHTVPLILNETTICVASDGKEEVCSDELLHEAMAVTVKGNLSEAGVKVKRVETGE